MCCICLFWLTDGSRHSYEFDVTSQTLAASDPMDVWVRVDSLDLPLPDDSQETFDVSLTNGIQS